jgi:hypothetical protein
MGAEFVTLQNENWMKKSQSVPVDSAKWFCPNIFA